MKQFLLVVLVALGACNRPAPEDCLKAIENMRVLIGTATPGEGHDESEVHRCVAGSSREAVACATKASSLDELKACQFMAKHN